MRTEEEMTRQRLRTRREEGVKSAGIEGGHMQSSGGSRARIGGKEQTLGQVVHPGLGEGQL